MRTMGGEQLVQRVRDFAIAIFDDITSERRQMSLSIYPRLSYTPPYDIINENSICG